MKEGKERRAAHRREGKKGKREHEMGEGRRRGKVHGRDLKTDGQMGGRTNGQTF